MVSVGRHENIQLLTYSEVEHVSGYVGNYQVRVRRKPRYVDEKLCTGCGLCAEVCPIEIDNPFDFNLNKRKAVYRNSPQAVPNAFAVDKLGIAPCRDACPTDQRTMGYIALVKENRFADAYWAIRREHPFPSICGRVCNRRCEDACSRGQLDEPVNIMGLKRFVADWAYRHRNELAEMQDNSLVGTPFSHTPVSIGMKVAIIGAGPAGLTAGLDLVRLGYGVTIFDQLPVAGGMMRVGIPPHRLPHKFLAWEVQQIVDEGVELKLNTYVDDIPGLMEGGYDAVVAATGAHRASKLPIPNSNHKDNLLSLDLLKQVALDQAPDLNKKKIAVLGGGNVALDSARTAVRLGASKVSMICLEPRGEMPGFDWEVQVAEEEGVEMFPGRVFKEIQVRRGRIAGVHCVEVVFRGFKRGQPDFDEIPDTDHIIPADKVVWAIGQRPDFSFLPQDGTVSTRVPIGILTDNEMMTDLPGLFAAGDVHRGMTFFVVDAIAEGHRVARCVDRYLRGEEGIPEPEPHQVAKLDVDEVKARVKARGLSSAGRIPIPSIPLEDRRNNFREVDLTLTEADAIIEAHRCVGCGICSECLACVAACDRGAIDHEMRESYEDFQAGAIILATGFKDFDPSQAPEFGYGLPNVFTAMEFERLMNTGGPTNGEVRLKNGKTPKRVAILHCVGSRDEKYHPYCSRVCCMYSIKLAQLVHEYVEAEVFEIYRDLRTFGKGYEEFYNRTKKAGVNFYHGRVTGVERVDGNLVVRWDENYHHEPDQVEVDMVILATGFEPQEDAGEVANIFGVNRSKDGFFLEKHPKLAPVESASRGIFMAGACQSPKDIPDSVVQAGGAAGAALSLLDQETVSLDPSVASVEEAWCAGCGSCVEACPYDAVVLEDGHAVVDVYQCKGCGTCAGTCPNKAMTLINFDDRQLVAELIGALR